MLDDNEKIEYKRNVIKLTSRIDNRSSILLIKKQEDHLSKLLILLDIGENGSSVSHYQGQHHIARARKEF